MPLMTLFLRAYSRVRLLANRAIIVQ